MISDEFYPPRFGLSRGGFFLDVECRIFGAGCIEFRGPEARQSLGHRLWRLRSETRPYTIGEQPKRSV